MKIGIHKNRYHRKNPFVSKYKKILDYNRIKNIELDSSDSDFLKKAADLDLFIFRWRQDDYDRQVALTVLPIVERQLLVKCFPNFNTYWAFDDKIREYLLLKSKGFPIIESMFFWEKPKALKFIETADFPIVFKLKGGAGSNGVTLLKNRKAAKKLINRMFNHGIKTGLIPTIDATHLKDFSIYNFLRQRGVNLIRRIRGEHIDFDWNRHKNYVLFQKFLPKNDYDTRITIIGDRAFAFRRFNRKNDFRSSGSGILDYNAKSIDRRCIKIAFNVSQSMGFQSMAYDFLFNENNEAEFCEISYTYMDTAIYECPGYWDSSMEWHEGHYWPQYFHLMDSLNYNDLKQPDSLLFE